MTAEEIHIKKLKELGYKDELIKELVNQFHRQQKYLFAEDIHQEKLKLLGIGVVSQQRELLVAFMKWQQNQWLFVNAENVDNTVDTYLSN